MAVVTLISGGLDSAVLAAEMHSKHFCQTALTIDYGQVSRREVACARDVAEAYADQHQVIQCKLSRLGPLTGDGRIPDGVGEGVSPVYLPGRNSIFLTLAVSIAESIGADYVAIGCNADDADGFPDCRPAFFDRFNQMLATLGHTCYIAAPLIDCCKAEVVKLGRELGVDFTRTSSCYRGTDCGRCEACRRRAEALTA
jgi:7-cyano-7-deazaguanine synthase